MTVENDIAILKTNYATLGRFRRWLFPTAVSVELAKNQTDPVRLHNAIKRSTWFQRWVFSSLPFFNKETPWTGIFSDLETGSIRHLTSESASTLLKGNPKADAVRQTMRILQHAATQSNSFPLDATQTREHPHEVAALIEHMRLIGITNNTQTTPALSHPNISLFTQVIASLSKLDLLTKQRFTQVLSFNATELDSLHNALALGIFQNAGHTSVANKKKNGYFDAMISSPHGNWHDVAKGLNILVAAWGTPPLLNDKTQAAIIAHPNPIMLGTALDALYREKKSLFSSELIDQTLAEVLDMRDLEELIANPIRLTTLLVKVSPWVGVHKPLLRSHELDTKVHDSPIKVSKSGDTIFGQRRGTASSTDDLDEEEELDEELDEIVDLDINLSSQKKPILKT